MIDKYTVGIILLTFAILLSYCNRHVVSLADDLPLMLSKGLSIDNHQMVIHRTCSHGYQPVPSLLLMVQRNPLQVMWYHLVLSWCNMVSEVRRRSVHEGKNIDHAKHDRTPHCWLAAKVMYPSNSFKRFSWLTRSTSILLMKNV